MDLALRIMETPGTRPAVGSAENRAGAVGGVDPLQFRRDEVERAGPRDRHEFVATPPLIGPRPALEPATPHHRPGDPRRVRQRGRNIAEQRRRIGIPRMRNDLDALFAEQHREGAPMRAVRQA